MSSDECMISDAALMISGGGSCASDVTLGSYLLLEGRGNELNIEQQDLIYKLC